MYIFQPYGLLWNENWVYGKEWLPDEKHNNSSVYYECLIVENNKESLENETMKIFDEQIDKERPDVF